MKSKTNKTHFILRLIGTVLFTAFYAGVFWDLYQRYQYMLREPISSWKASFFVVGFYFLAIVGITYLFLWDFRFLKVLRQIRRRLGWGRWLGIIAAGFAVSGFFLFARWSEIFTGTYAKLFVFLSVYGMMAFLAGEDTEKNFDRSGSVSSLLIFSFSFAFLSNYQTVTNYPFQLSWSEGNRLWDYSLLYGRYRYLYPADQPIPSLTDVGRQSLWGLIFLIPNINIFAARLWSSLVWTFPHLIFGWVLFSSKSVRWSTWFLAGLWAFVFLNQGPIYSTLILGAILVALSRKVPPMLGLILVGLAGYYCHLSRFTWMFAPAIWAGVTYLALPHRRIKPTAKNRWLWAVAYGFAGLLGGFIIPVAIPKFISLLRNPAMPAALPQPTSVQQPLLWERLFPNPTYAPGILLGLVQAVLPLIFLLLVMAWNSKLKLDIWQKMAVFGSLLAFLVVGLVISVKIGGGSNLHNLDMFLIGLLFTAWLVWEKGGDLWIERLDQLRWYSFILLILLILLPIYPALLEQKPLEFPSMESAQTALAEIKTYVEENKSEGEILFIDNRQLLTFGYVPNIPLVPEYEKKVLMNEAMAEDAAYFEQFYQDLRQKRFRLIITEPLVIKFQGGEYHFGNENDAWVKWVAIPLTCYYEPAETFEQVGIVLLTPRDIVLADADLCSEFFE